MRIDHCPCPFPFAPSRDTPQLRVSPEGRSRTELGLVSPSYIHSCSIRVSFVSIRGSNRPLCVSLRAFAASRDTPQLRVSPRGRSRTELRLESPSYIHSSSIRVSFLSIRGSNHPLCVSLRAFEPSRDTPQLRVSPQERSRTELGLVSPSYMHSSSIRVSFVSIRGSNHPLCVSLRAFA